MSSRRIVVAGGGFAGLWAAVAAAREFAIRGNEKASVTLVSRDPYLTVRPRLYEAISPELRVPLASVLGPAGVHLCQANIFAVSPSLRQVTIENHSSSRAGLAYDRLILATGSELRPLQVPGLAQHAFNIDTHAAALALDEHLAALGRMSARSGNNTIVILGAGFTGLELASEIRGRLTMHWGPARAAIARVILIEQADVTGSGLGANPRPYIEAALQQQGVEVRLNTRLARVEPGAVLLASGEWIETGTTIVTAGLRASPLAQAVYGAETDDLGRLHVDRALRVKGVSEVYAAGDIAHACAGGEHVAPMSCQHAILMGQVAGHNAARDMLGLSPQPYQQPDYVTCLDLGPAGALFTEGWERRVRHTGAEGKKLKRQINTEWIYPPQNDRTALFETVRAGLRRSGIHD